METRYFNTFTAPTLGRKGAKASPWSKKPMVESNNGWQGFKAYRKEGAKRDRLALIKAAAEKLDK